MERVHGVMGKNKIGELEERLGRERVRCSQEGKYKRRCVGVGYVGVGVQGWALVEAEVKTECRRGKGVSRDEIRGKEVYRRGRIEEQKRGNN